MQAAFGKLLRTENRELRIELRVTSHKFAHCAGRFWWSHHRVKTLVFQNACSARLKVRPFKASDTVDEMTT
jgi:hypothetical protein